MDGKFNATVRALLGDYAREAPKNGGRLEIQPELRRLRIQKQEAK